MHARRLIGALMVSVLFATAGSALAADTKTPPTPKDPQDPTIQSIPINYCGVCPLLYPAWACRIYCG